MTPEKLDELERLVDDAAGEAFLPEGWQRIVAFLPDLIAAARREAALREQLDELGKAYLECQRLLGVSR